jgi:hypothetical protein
MSRGGSKLVIPVPDPSAQAATKANEVVHPVLEDFECRRPAIRFVNLRRLAQASQELDSARKALLAYHPAGQSITPQFHYTRDSLEDPTPPDAQSPPPEATDAVPLHILGRLPSLAPVEVRANGPADADFRRLMRHQALERQEMAFSFRREQQQILDNFYDAQLREASQKNDPTDHRPLSEALRNISRRTGYPAEFGVPRFYKSQFRAEKLGRKFGKSLEKLQQNQEWRADVLQQKQRNDVEAYADIRHLDLSRVEVPKLPAPPAADATE